MALSFDDILTALCSEVQLFNQNDLQKVYALQSDTEAKLAYDVLVAYGFNARVYHAPPKPSKLYIAHPELPPESLEQTLAAALAYARALKRIASGLDELCRSGFPLPDSHRYTIAFANAQPGHKQILIHVIPLAAGESAAPPPVAAPAAAPVETAAAAPASPPVSVKISSADPRIMKKIRRKQDPYEGFASGPAVGRGNYPVQILPEGGNRQESWRRRLMLRMFGNFATSGYAALIWVIFFGLLFGVFVVSKAFLCYNFVAKMPDTWYCRDLDQPDPKEIRKQQQLERQKQLGLPPTS